MANRRILHRSKLETFLSWCRSKGHTVTTKSRDYEVARVAVAGWKHPVLVYDRNDGDHLTVFGNGERLVREFCREGKSAA